LDQPDYLWIGFSLWMGFHASHKYPQSLLPVQPDKPAPQTSCHHNCSNMRSKFPNPPSVNPNTVGTVDTVDTYYTVKKLTNKRPHKWKRADVLEFLIANKDEYDLDDQDIKIIERNRVSGPDFLTLTKKDLHGAPYDLPDGVARRIELLINSLKTPQCKFLPYYNEYLMLIPSNFQLFPTSLMISGRITASSASWTAWRKSLRVGMICSKFSFHL